MNVVVGLFCLGSLWITALLVAGAALQDLRDAWALRERLRPLAPGRAGVGVVAGDVRDGSGPAGALATHTITQLGRALESNDGANAIAYRDVARTSKLHGGVVRAMGTTILIEDLHGLAAVWTSQRAREERAEYTSIADAETAHPAACTAKGHARAITTELRAGDPVFVAGELWRRDGTWVVTAPFGGEVIVSTGDPRAIVARTCAELVAFVALELLACLGCTVLAAWPPVFGHVSMLGAALCLGFFLGVTPLGVWLRERARPQSDAPLHGTWKSSATSTVLRDAPRSPSAGSC